MINPSATLSPSPKNMQITTSYNAKGHRVVHVVADAGVLTKPAAPYKSRKNQKGIHKKPRKQASRKTVFSPLLAPSTPHNTTEYLMDLHSSPIDSYDAAEFSINTFGTNDHLILMMKCC